MYLFQFFKVIIRYIEKILIYIYEIDDTFEWFSYKTRDGWYKKRFGILELQNRVTQNDFTLEGTNSKIFIEILFTS